LAVLILDILSKQWALHSLSLVRTEHPFGAWLPLTLSFNRGAAFSVSFGEASNLIFMVAAAVALVVLYRFYRSTPAHDHLKLVALALIAGGALGNLIDRVIRWPQGVVDFIGPYNLNLIFIRYPWPIFNVADMGITCGAVALALSMWRDSHSGQRSPETVSPPPGEAPHPGSL